MTDETRQAAEFITRTVGDLADMGREQDAAEVWRRAGMMDARRLIAYASRVREKRDAVPWIVPRRKA